jgi:hypothetical protein
LISSSADVSNARRFDCNRHQNNRIWIWIFAAVLIFDA